MNSRLVFTSIVGVLFAGATPAQADDARAAPALGALKRFIGCPIYRDTDAGRKSGCWLTTDYADGLQYDVTTARVKPMLGRKVLVEGVVSAADTHMCGGLVLEPVSVSVLPGDCPRYLIPAEGHSGRKFALPAKVMQPTHAPRAIPAPPYTPREYTILFELNSDFLVYQYSELIIEEAALYAKAAKPQHVSITGYAATRGFDASGETLREDIAVAEARARMVAEAFTRLGISGERLELHWREAPPQGFPAPNGLSEEAKRRVTIRIEPGRSERAARKAAR